MIHEFNRAMNFMINTFIKQYYRIKRFSIHKPGVVLLVVSLLFFNISVFAYGEVPNTETADSIYLMVVTSLASIHIAISINTIIRIKRFHKHYFHNMRRTWFYSRLKSFKFVLSEKHRPDAPWDFIHMKLPFVFIQVWQDFYINAMEHDERFSAETIKTLLKLFFTDMQKQFDEYNQFRLLCKLAYGQWGSFIRMIGLDINIHTPKYPIFTARRAHLLNKMDTELAKKRDMLFSTVVLDRDTFIDGVIDWTDRFQKNNPDVVEFMRIERNGGKGALDTQTSKA